MAKWQNAIFVLAVMMMLAAIIPNASATTKVYLSEGQKVLDAKGNEIIGTGSIVVIGDINKTTISPPCNLWCEIKSLFGLQSIAALSSSPSITQGGTLPAGNLMKMESTSPDCSGEYSGSALKAMAYPTFTYLDKDGKIYTGQFGGDVSLDLTPLNPAIGGSGISGQATNSIVIGITPQPPALPSVSKDGQVGNWILDSSDKGTFHCSPAPGQIGGFFQAGQTDTYTLTVDTATGLDAEIVNYKAVYAKGEDALISVRVENRIADGILGGLMLTEKSLSYQTATNLTTLDAVPLKKGNNTFYVRPPTDSLNNNELQIIPYVKVEIPYVSLESDPSATSGSGMKAVQRNVTWFGSSDKIYTLDYLVLFGEQIGPQKASSKLYVSPYKKVSLVNGSYHYAPVSYSDQSSSSNYIWIGLGIVAAFGIGYFISKKY